MAALEGSIQILGRSTAGWPSAADLLMKQLALDTDTLEVRVRATDGPWSGAIRIGLPIVNSMPGSPTNNQLVTAAGMKAFVLSQLASGVVKGYADVASTGNMNLSSMPSTQDGITLVNGMRILAKDQTAAEENGVYTFLSAGSAAVRVNDLGTFDSLAITNIMVDQGGQANTLWYCGAATGGTLGTTVLPYAQFSAGATYTADETSLHLASGVFAIKAGGVTSTELGAASVTLAKMANLAANSFIGNNTGSGATPIAMTVAQAKSLLAIAVGDVSGLAAIATSGSASDLVAGTVPAAQMPAHTGDVTSSAGAVALTIAANAVTNAKAAQMAANTLKGNNTGSSANSIDLTVSQVKTLLGLVPGTDVAVYSLLLANIAALTTAADKGLYFTGSNTPGTYDLSAFARTILDDANAAAVLATIGAYASTTRLQDILKPTASVDMNSQALVNLLDPTSAQDAATKAYVDALAAGLKPKDSVRAISLSNITLSAPQTVDGVSVVNGDRVLVAGQSSARDNGIYVCRAGTWLRTSDADTSAEVKSGMYCFIEEGTLYKATGWVLSTANPITLGTTSLSFTQFSGTGDIVDGLALTKTGNTLDVNVDGSTIEVSGDNLRLKDGGVTLAKFASLAANSFIGNNTGSGATPIAMTVAQAKTLLAIAYADVSGLAAIAASGSASDLSGGTVPAARMPAHTGDVTSSAGAVALTIGAAKVTNAMLAGGIDLTAKVTGSLPLANGGTGGTDASTARTALGLGSAALMNEIVASAGSGQTTASTSYVDITGVSGAMVANGLYTCDVYVIAECSSASGGIGISLNGSASATYVAGRMDGTQSAGNYAQAMINAYDGGTAAATVLAANTPYFYCLSALVKNAGSSSTLTARVARGGSAGTITIRAVGMVLRQIA